MSKSPDAFRTISEVSEWLETPAHVLRFWESKFTQVKPVKRAGGRRYYRPADMELLGGIKKLLHEDGLTIKGVQKVLREQGVRYVATLSPSVDGPEEGELIEDAPFTEVDSTPGEVIAFRAPPKGAHSDVAPDPDPAPEPDGPPASVPEEPEEPQGVADVAEAEETPEPEANVFPEEAAPDALGDFVSESSEIGSPDRIQDAPIPDLQPAPTEAPPLAPLPPIDPDEGSQTESPEVGDTEQGGFAFDLAEDLAPALSTPDATPDATELEPLDALAEADLAELAPAEQSLSDPGANPENLDVAGLEPLDMLPEATETGWPEAQPDLPPLPDIDTEPDAPAPAEAAIGTEEPPAPVSDDDTQAETSEEARAKEPVADFKDAPLPETPDEEWRDASLSEGPAAIMDTDPLPEVAGALWGDATATDGPRPDQSDAAWSEAPLPDPSAETPSDRLISEDPATALDTEPFAESDHEAEAPAGEVPNSDSLPEGAGDEDAQALAYDSASEDIAALASGAPLMADLDPIPEPAPTPASNRPPKASPPGARGLSLQDFGRPEDAGPDEVAPGLLGYAARVPTLSPEAAEAIARQFPALRARLQRLTGDPF